MLRCLEGEYVILAREQVYKERYLHFPATSNFPIHHLQEPPDLTQRVECLHMLNDPFTKQMPQMQMRKLVNIADAGMLDPLISHCGSDLHTNLIYTWLSEEGLKAFEKSCTTRPNQIQPCKLPRWKTTWELCVSYSVQFIGRAGYKSTKQSLLSLIKTCLSKCEFGSQ